MLGAILEYTSTAHMPSIFQDNALKDRSHIVSTSTPERMEHTRLHLYSKVLENNLGAGTRPLPQCPHLVWSQAIPLNVSAPSNLYKSQKLLNIIEDSKGTLESGINSRGGDNETKIYDNNNNTVVI